MTDNIVLKQSPDGRAGIRWLMLSFAFLATVFNYIDRLAFNYLSAEGPLRAMIPNDYFGYIATAFFVAYMVSNLVSGFIIDRLGTRLGYASHKETGRSDLPPALIFPFHDTIKGSRMPPSYKKPLPQP